LLRVRAFDGGVEDVEHAFSRGPGCLQHLVQAVQPGNGLIEEAQVEEEPNHLAQGELAGQDLASAHPDHQDHSEGPGKGHRRGVNRPDAHNAEASLAQVVGPFGEALIFVDLAAEALDLADALQIVHEKSIHGAGGHALDAIAAVSGQGVPEGPPDQQGQGNEGHERKLRVGGEHDRRNPQDAEHRDAPLLRPVDQHPFHGIDIFQHAGHEVTRGTLVKIVHRQPLEPVINVAAHVIDYILLERIVEADAEGVKEVAKEERAKQAQGDGSKQVAATLTDDPVDDVLG
jgi:hypothetical protein